MITQSTNQNPLAGMLARAVEQQPSRMAVAHEDGVLTYAQLGTRAASLAKVILRRLKPDPSRAREAVIVLTEHDAHTPELYWGVILSGQTLVPVSSRLPDTAIASIAAQCGARLGLIAPDSRSRLAGLTSSTTQTRWISHPDFSSPANVPLPPRAAVQIPADIAMMSFTSGTTGKPKGVLLTERNLVATALAGADAFSLDDGNRQVNPLPLAHFSGASRVITSVANCGTQIILPEFDSRRVLQAIQKWEATHITVVPSMVPHLLDLDVESYNISSLQTLTYGTAPMAIPIIEELHHRLACGLVNGYGLTEAAGVVATLGPDAHVASVSTSDAERLSSVGRPVLGVEVSLMDEDGSPASTCREGQIAVRGPKVSPGYLIGGDVRTEHLTGGWLPTGDLGRLTETGDLIILGRADDLIISGGLNVQPREIESAASMVTGVSACAAFGVASDRWGQEVHIAVVPKPGSDFTTAAFLAQLRTTLDPYKIPKAVHIVTDLPRSNVGKIDRRGMSAHYSVRRGE